MSSLQLKSDLVEQKRCNSVHESAHDLLARNLGTWQDVDEHLSQTLIYSSALVSHVGCSPSSASIRERTCGACERAYIT